MRNHASEEEYSCKLSNYAKDLLCILEFVRRDVFMIKKDNCDIFTNYVIRHRKNEDWYVIVRYIGRSRKLVTVILTTIHISLETLGNISKYKPRKKTHDIFIERVLVE